MAGLSVMPDLPDRDELERKLARELGKLGQVWMGKILELLGDPPDLTRLTEEMWTELGGALEAVIRPFLTNLYEESAARLLNIAPSGVEWGLIHEHAVDWARDYSFNLVTNINNTTRRALQSKIPQFFEQQMTIGELRNSLGSLFGPVRADMIASTEITRASVEGEKALVDELEKSGIGMRPIWQTSNDELVCPMCGPLHNQEIINGIYPPAHVRCRCWVNYRVRRDYH